MIMGNFQESVMTGMYSLVSFILNVAPVGVFITARSKHIKLDSFHNC